MNDRNEQTKTVADLRSDLDAAAELVMQDWEQGGIPLHLEAPLRALLDEQADHLTPVLFVIDAYEGRTRAVITADGIRLEGKDLLGEAILDKAIAILPTILDRAERTPRPAPAPQEADFISAFRGAAAIREAVLMGDQKEREEAEQIIADLRQWLTDLKDTGTAPMVPEAEAEDEDEAMRPGARFDLGADPTPSPAFDRVVGRLYDVAGYQRPEGLDGAETITTPERSVHLTAWQRRHLQDMAEAAGKTGFFDRTEADRERDEAIAQERKRADVERLVALSHSSVDVAGKLADAGLTPRHEDVRKAVVAVEPPQRPDFSGFTLTGANADAMVAAQREAFFQGRSIVHVSYKIGSGMTVEHLPGMLSPRNA